MKLSKPLGLVAIVGMLIPASAALASQGNGKSGKPKAEESEQADKDKKDKKDKVPVHQVPEPATIALLGTAAAVAGARKLWQRRRRSRSV